MRWSLLLHVLLRFVTKPNFGTRSADNSSAYKANRRITSATPPRSPGLQTLHTILSRCSAATWAKCLIDTHYRFPHLAGPNHQDGWRSEFLCAICPAIMVNSVSGKGWRTCDANMHTEIHVIPHNRGLTGCLIYADATQPAPQLLAMAHFLCSCCFSPLRHTQKLQNWHWCLLCRHHRSQAPETSQWDSNTQSRTG